MRDLEMGVFNKGRNKKAERLRRERKSATAIVKPNVLV